MNLKTAIELINLQEIALQLEQTAKSIEAKVRGSDQRFNISASMLIKKIPELKVFGNQTIFQARWIEEDSLMRIQVPSVCKSIESDDVIVQLPDLEVLDNIEYVRYVTGLGGYAIIKIQNQEFQIALIANLDLEDELMKDTEGEGMPPGEILGYERRPETPLKSDLVPINEELVVVSNGRKSREHATPLCDLKVTSTGQIIKNVICNRQLERMIEKYGVEGNCRFKVTRKSELKDKKSKVSILDLNGFDFSDLEV